MKFKHLDETELKHQLNQALNNCLEKEQIKIKSDELAQEMPLELDYYELLNHFESHIKMIISINKKVD